MNISQRFPVAKETTKHHLILYPKILVGKGSKHQNTVKTMINILAQHMLFPTISSISMITLPIISPNKFSTCFSNQNQPLPLKDREETKKTWPVTLTSSTLRLPSCDDTEPGGRWKRPPALCLFGAPQQWPRSRRANKLKQIPEHYTYNKKIYEQNWLQTQSSDRNTPLNHIKVIKRIWSE